VTIGVTISEIGGNSCEMLSDCWRSSPCVRRRRSPAASILVALKWRPSLARHTAATVVIASGGGTVGFSAGRHVLIVAEGTYARLPGEVLDLDPLSPGTTVLRVGQGKLLGGFAGIHAQYPIPDTRIAPYSGFGVGAVWSTFEGEVRIPATVLFGQPVPATTFRQTFKQSSLALTVPFGVRFYISDRWGLRPEVGVTWGRELTTFYRFSVGLFYQLGKSG